MLRWTQQRFAARGLPSPRLDAELLLAHTLQRSRVGLYTHFDQPLSKDELARYRECIVRRLAGVPVAYLTGEKEFYGLSLHVSEAVLIPRPETELLVDVAVRLLPPAPISATVLADAEHEPEPTSSVDVAAGSTAEPRASSLHEPEPGIEMTVHYDATEAPVEEEQEAAVQAKAEGQGTASTEPAMQPGTQPNPAESSQEDAGRAVARVIDVGTGSGAVALAIKHLRPDVEVLAVDISPVAIAVATENAARLGLLVEFWQGDLLSALPADRQADVLVANLPYIPTAEIAALQAEVRHEPHSALDGGSDGLVVVRRLLSQSRSMLRRGGAIALEIGAGQAAATMALLHQAGFVDVRSELDLAKIPRVVHGRLL